MKILITGTRALSPEEVVKVQFRVVKEVMDINKLLGLESFELIHGAARGVDSAVEGLKKFNHPYIKITAVPADWSQGKVAGIWRNIKMLDMAPQLVLAFHTDPKLGKGTKHCVEEALKRKIPTHIYIL